MEFKGSYREWIADRKASQANYRVEWGEHPLETASVLTDMQSSSISIQGEGRISRKKAEKSEMLGSALCKGQAKQDMQDGGRQACRAC